MTMEILVARSIRTGRAVSIRYACRRPKAIVWNAYGSRQTVKQQRSRK
jgi:hypothetical protein